MEYLGKYKYGRKNPVIIVANQIYKFFRSKGFNVVFGKEVETYYNNFKGLNVEENSFITLEDATFYTRDNFLLRSHLSPIWLREIKRNKTKFPLAFMEIGKVYRHDSSGSLYRPMFYQAEVVLIDKNLSLSNLKEIMEEFVQYIFNGKRKIYFHPYWHSFTCPGVKIDVDCICNHDNNCVFCKGTNLVNISTAGMIDEKILRECGYDSTIQGISIGLGPTRLVQLLENVENIQEIYDNNINLML